MTFIGKVPLVCAFLLLSHSPVWGLVEAGKPDKVPESSPLSQPLDRYDSEDKGTHSIAPIVGYDPTFGGVLGAAYFYEQRNLAAGIDVNTNFRKVYQLHYSFRHQFSGPFEYGFKGGVTKGYDPYYGEGGETKVAEFHRLWGLLSNNRLYLAAKVSAHTTIGVFGDMRTRTETPGEGSPSQRVAPDERTVAVGIYHRVDTRKKTSRTKDGFSFGSYLTHVPSAFSTVPGVIGFTQIEGDFIVYKEILEEVVSDVVAAFSVRGGYTFGTPTYAFTYRLGGSDSMRGYLENRFRGKKFYLQQTELRFPIVRPFSGAAFVGFGDTTNEVFDNAKMAYGIGLRIGLPPDWNNQIRIDVGYGKDQWGVFANFGQIF